jgi:hypothetical protein
VFLFGTVTVLRKVPTFFGPRFASDSEKSPVWLPSQVPQHAIISGLSPLVLSTTQEMVARFVSTSTASLRVISERAAVTEFHLLYASLKAYHWPSSCFQATTLRSDRQSRNAKFRQYASRPMAKPRATPSPKEVLSHRAEPKACTTIRFPHENTPKNFLHATSMGKRNPPLHPTLGITKKERGEHRSISY